MITPYTITTAVEIPPHRIRDLIVTAIEGGSSYWCRAARLKSPDRGRILHTPWYDDASIYGDEFTIVFIPDDDDPVEMTRESIARGLSLLAERHPDHVTDILEENEDADTADAFVQLCLFGEVRYG